MRVPSPDFRSIPVARLRGLLTVAAAFALLAGAPLLAPLPWSVTAARADEEPPPPPPPPDEEIGYDDRLDGGSAAEASDLDAPAEGDVTPLEPGEAVVTRFSHSVEEPDSEGQPVRIIDVNGITASIIDIRRPAEPPSGQHWINEPQRLLLTAGETGQVFGVALADMGGDSPDIFLTATAAFGLHRTGLPPGNTEWIQGMWGPDGGAGSIYRVSLENGYLPEKFADITLNGRANTGPALGNIAFDPWHKRLFVSDLETGMIHSIDAATGQDLGHYDHGALGRAGFTDAQTGQPVSLSPVSFDPVSAARLDDCPTNFSTSPECWNIADFRRRVWGLNVRSDDTGAVRLYYSVWGSDAFGNPDWPSAGDDRRNAVWSVAITRNGLFDAATVRREFFLPAFWPSTSGLDDKAGNSNAVSDITFPECGPQNVMLVAERGGMRNLGLGKDEAFSRPYESRVLRYELGQDNIWRAKGRYEVGFHDRMIKIGPPKAFASAAGGAAFGYGLDSNGVPDLAAPSQSVWMTGDGLCSADGPCTAMETGEHTDASEVHGLQGSGADATVAIDAPPNPDALDRSYMIDTDVNLGPDGEVIAIELARNDATGIGDVAIYQVCDAQPLPLMEEPKEWGAPPLPPIVEPPEFWPVHNLRASHDKWASSGHRVQRSWHRREGSWHDVDRSWHWKQQSYHSRNRTWHWREGSWHSKAQSWHVRGRSQHDKRYSWHHRDRSWHLKSRTFHAKNRSWSDDHVKNRSFHVKGRTWGDHFRGKSYHFKGRTWNDHAKGQSYHVRDRTWSGDHVKGKSYHVRDRTWSGNHVKGRTYHVKGKTWGDGDKPRHVKGRTFHVKSKTWGDSDKPRHVKGRTFHVKSKTWDGGKPEHSKRQSQLDQKPQHSKRQSQLDQKPQHSKRQSQLDQKPQHSKRQSQLDQKPQHSKRQSQLDQKPQHSKRQSQLDQLPKHSKKQTRAQQQQQQTEKPQQGQSGHRKNRSIHVRENSLFLPAQ